jgi:hypothetical protein
MKLTQYGYKLATIDDKSFWDSYNYDIERLDQHNHDGLNSAPLAPGAAVPFGIEIEIIDWIGVGPFTFPFNFPVGWDMTWDAGDPCPVRITVYDMLGNIVYLDQAAKLDGLGFILTSSVAGNYIVGVT